MKTKKKNEKNDAVRMELKYCEHCWKLVAAREWSGKCVLRKLPAESGAASASQEVSGKTLVAGGNSCGDRRVRDRK